MYAYVCAYVRVSSRVCMGNCMYYRFHVNFELTATSYFGTATLLGPGSFPDPFQNPHKQCFHLGLTNSSLVSHRA